MGFQAISTFDASAFEFIVVDGTPDTVKFLFNPYTPGVCYGSYPSSPFPLTTGDITMTAGKKIRS